MLTPVLKPTGLCDDYSACTTSELHAATLVKGRMGIIGTYGTSPTRSVGAVNTLAYSSMPYYTASCKSGNCIVGTISCTKTYNARGLTTEAYGEVHVTDYADASYTAPTYQQYGDLVVCQSAYEDDASANLTKLACGTPTVGIASIAKFVVGEYGITGSTGL